MITHIAMQRSSQRNTENSVPPQRIISKECPFVGLFFNISFVTDATQPCCSDVYVMFRGDNKEKFKNPTSLRRQWSLGGDCKSFTLEQIWGGSWADELWSNLGSVVSWVSLLFLMRFSDHSQILSWNSRWYCVYICIYIYICMIPRIPKCQFRGYLSQLFGFKFLPLSSGVTISENGRFQECEPEDLPKVRVCWRHPKSSTFNQIFLAKIYVDF